MQNDWCLYRLKRQMKNKQLTTIKDIPVLGVTNVPETKNADAVISAIMLSGTSIGADMFLEREDRWPAEIRRRWKAFKNKVAWDDLMRQVSKRVSAAGSSGSSELW